MLYTKVISVCLSIILCLNPVITHADVVGRALQLPVPGGMVRPSTVFNPTLLRGMVVHPDKPLQFDFIVDSGDEKLVGDELKNESQRMINYFLASLTIPEQDLWVNLSPVEKNRIVPDQLIKTELGRDLLSQDYILKQLTASFIYPEEGLGQSFWNQVYERAARQFGLTEIPVDVFNKVWIVPQRATVIEKGNSVYVVDAHLKIMLEADYYAQGLAGEKAFTQTGDTPAAELTKQLLREIIVPAIEKEVNEGKNFSKLRQIVYSMVLSQWYQDILKGSLLNKNYAGKNKISGIDLSDPKNKELIYQQYMAAYNKGVFNYVKEEIDQITHETLPRKYFSGGFKGIKIPRDTATTVLSNIPTESFRIVVDLKDASQISESYLSWNNPNRPVALLKELQELWDENNNFNRAGLMIFLKKYSNQVAEQEDLYPVQAAWPVLKAFLRLKKFQKNQILEVITEEYNEADLPNLIEGLFLINKRVDHRWADKAVPQLKGRRTYLLAAEIHHWAGGLGPVMKFLGKELKALGVDAAYVTPWYLLRRDKGNDLGDVLNYKDMGISNLDEEYDSFYVKIGDKDGINIHTVKVQVASGVDENNVPVFMLKDVQIDNVATTFYTKMLYNYEGKNNPVTKEESMAFINVAGAEFLLREEMKRKNVQGINWKPAVVHSNDGQLAPLTAVIKSRYNTHPVIRDILWAFTTHTYFNRGASDAHWGVRVFLKHMLGITDRYTNASRAVDGDYIDHTSLGARLADVFLAVANTHANDVRYKDPETNLVAMTNGAIPEEMALVFYSNLKQIAVDIEEPTAMEISRAKHFSKVSFNEIARNSHLFSSLGRLVQIDKDAIVFGCARRGVWEKAGMTTAWTKTNIINLMKNRQKKVNVLLLLNDQGSASDKIVEFYTKLEEDIIQLKAQFPEEYPGNFYFVKSFTPEQKIAYLGASDGDIKASAPHTGANETTEEDIAANAGLQFGPNNGGVGEGAIIAQGTVWNHENLGNIVLADTESEYAAAFQKVLNAPPDELAQAQLISYQYGRNLMLAVRTAALNAKAYNKTLALREAFAAEDSRVQDLIVDDLQFYPGAVRGILSTGRNGVTAPFGFYVRGMGIPIYSEGLGLRYFIAKERELISKYGKNVFIQHYARKDFENYLSELFHGLQGSHTLVNRWIESVALTDVPLPEKNARLLRFIDNLQQKIEVKFMDVAIRKRDAHFLLYEVGDGFTWHTDKNGSMSFVEKTGKGLLAFVEAFDRMKALPDIMQYHAKTYFPDYVLYISDLFDQNPIMSSLEGELKDKLDSIRMLYNEQTDAKIQYAKELMTILDGYVTKLQMITDQPDKSTPEKNEPLATDNAQKTGGIDVRNIEVDRNGQLIANVINDRAIEDKILNASGLQAIIIQLTPIANLQVFLQ